MKYISLFLNKILVGHSAWRHLLFFTFFFCFYMIGAVNEFVSGSIGLNKLCSHFLQFSIYMLEFYLVYISYWVAARQNNLLVMILAFLGIPLITSILSADVWNVYLQPSISFLNYYPFSVFYFFMVVSIKFAKDKYVENLKVLERREQQKEMEINFLKSQISPHFLFNTLNNLYGHAVKKSDELPEMMIKLSELLRYSIYEANKTFVPLQDELDYIKNYISLEKMRVSKEIDINIEIPECSNPSLQIAPLILINFIENAFKHSRNVILKQSFIYGRIEVINNCLKLHIKNTYNTETENTDFLKKESGLGHKNTIKRLDLVYGKNYQMYIDKKEGIFDLSLTIYL